MNKSYRSRPRQGRAIVASGAVAVLLALPATAAAVSPRARAPHRAEQAAKPYFDSRAGARRTAPRRGAPALRSPLGRRTAVAIDPITGTPRSVQRLDGTLTGPSSADRADVATRWIADNRAALGLSAAAVGTLELDDRTVTPATGVTHLRYRQVLQGIPAFDNGLRVNLDRGGRILNVTGSPLADLSLASATPALSAEQAMAALQRNVGVRRSLRVKSRSTGARRTTTFAGGDFARLVVFGAASGPRLAWHLTYQATSVAYYDAVVDATTGTVLYRQNLTKFAASASVWPNYPGAERDTKPPDGFDKSTTNGKVSVDLESSGWLAAGASNLSGSYVHTYSDTNDDNAAQTSEEVGRFSLNSFNWPFTNFPRPTWNGVDTDGNPNDSEDGYVNACDYSGTTDPNLAPWPDPLGLKADCAWNPTVPTSWQANRRQNGVQAFYLANVFRDHLARTSIGFTPTRDGFAFDDPVQQETDDGAAGGPGGGPDGDHINNANMSTPPDGISPRMQMYLFATNPSGTFTFRNINGGDDAGTVWHEYTHGLSNRLVVNDDGSGALSTPHAGAMGEAWSDWYALDLLHRPPLPPATVGPLEVDEPMAGDVDVGTSTDAVFTATRFEPIDCAPEDVAEPYCPGGVDTGPGGYTFGDFGHVAGDGVPEVHSDGEIWMQTLWELRSRLIDDAGAELAGSDKAEELITEAMRLSPPEPSFLDQRNAILAADEAADGGANRDLIWAVFAHRGMGYYASVRDSSDVTPFENFDLPPDPNAPKGTITGTARSDSGAPLGGIPVGIGGHTTTTSTGAPAPGTVTTTTDSAGHYALQVPAHTYKSLVFVAKGGYDGAVVSDVPVPANGSVTRDVTLARDWAALKGGAKVLKVKDGTRYDDTGASFGCGLDQIADQSQGTGVSAFNPKSTDPENPHLGPPTAVVELPRAVTITTFGLDPSNTCGDDESATTKDYTLETSPDGSNWTLAKRGAFTLANRNKLNSVAPTAGATGVRFVRLRLLSPQSEAAGDSGVDFIDFSELEVYGTVAPSGSLTAAPSAAKTGEPVTLTASFTDPDGDAISAYAWDLDGNGTTDQTTTTPSTSHAYPAAGTFHPAVAARDARGGTGSAATTVTVTSTTPPPEKKPKIGKLPKRSRHARVSFRVRCDTRCTLRTSLRVSKATRRKLGLRSRTVAHPTRRFQTTTKSRKITIRIPLKVRRAATRHGVRTLRVRLSATARTAGGKKDTAARTLRIRLR